MRICHIGTADNIGGAAHASFTLHRGLIAAGHESTMLVNQQNETRRPEIDRIGWSRSFWPSRIMERLVLETEKWTGLQYQIQPWKNQPLRHTFSQDADVIHFHNLHGNFFAPSTIPLFRKPIVWTLHDTWALTGHCAYNHDCDLWACGCRQCPRLDEYPPIKLDTAGWLWRQKQRIYREAKPVFVCPSRWLANMARVSPLTEGCDVRHVPYGIDLDYWKPLNREKSREVLGIPQDQKVIMAIAAPGGERKGIADLLKVLQGSDWTIGVIGVGGLDFSGQLPDRITPYIQGEVDQVWMRLFYSAADAFVLPTHADNLPLTVMESFACGTPVVGYDVGGVPDLVRHGVNGYVVPFGDLCDLASGIRCVLNNPPSREACRRSIEGFSVPAMVERYVELYSEITLTRSASG